MKTERKGTGFSLTEVLMAVGILGVGMLFIAGTFPVAIYFNTVAAERTEAAIAADEAFAKIRLYGVSGFTSPPWPVNPYIECADFNDLWYQTSIIMANPALRVDPNEFAYPSTDMPLMAKQYYWSALCRRVDLNNVQVTAFISRKTSAGRRYWDRDVTGQLKTDALIPVPVLVGVDITPGSDEVLIIDAGDGNRDGIDEVTFIGEGCTIVDNKTGRLYRVLERYAVPNDGVILLDRPWWGSDGSGVDAVWVVPPAVGGGRYPCVAVYQRVIRF